MHNKYKIFADQPLSSIYFKAIELLISKDIPLTNEVMDKISLIMASIDLVIREMRVCFSQFLISPILTTIVCGLFLFSSPCAIAKTEKTISLENDSPTAISLSSRQQNSQQKVDKKELEGVEVKFDYSGHPQERKTFYHYYLSKYGTDKHHPIQEGEIGIFLYDLNNDGEKEILVYLRNPGCCGSAGCEFKIFKKLSDSAGIIGKVNIGNLNVPEEMKILNTKTLGYHNLLFYGPSTWKPSVIWKWDGNRYNFNKSLENVHYQGN